MSVAAMIDHLAFFSQMSSKSHVQELQLEKEKVNEVRVYESFDKKATQTVRQK